MNAEILVSKAEMELFFYSKFESFATFLEGRVASDRVSCSTLEIKSPSSAASDRSCRRVIARDLIVLGIADLAADW